MKPSMENSFKSITEQSNSVLILLPVKPDLDQVAAGLALHLTLGKTKEVALACPTAMTVEFNRLIGVNKITQDVGNKNLIIKFADYKASDIERVSYDIENRQFRLSVIPKPGVSAPEKGQIELSYAGVSSDTVILIGGVNDSHFPALSTKDVVGAKLVHIGLRELSLESRMQVISFARPASSVSEIVTGLIKESGLTLDSDVATNLLRGIEGGSNKFSNPNVGAQTFQLVSELMQAGGRRSTRDEIQKSEYPPGAIPGQITQAKPQEKPKETPKDWLQPKIYKGTSIS